MCAAGELRPTVPTGIVAAYATTEVVSSHWTEARAER